MQTAEGLPSVCQHAWQLSQWIYSCWICTLDPGQEAQMTCCKGLKSDSVTYMKLNLFIGFNKTFKTWHRRGNKEGNMSCKSAGCASCSLPIFLFGSWEVLMLGFAAWCHLPVSSGHLEVSYIYIYSLRMLIWKTYRFVSIHSFFQVSFAASRRDYPRLGGCTTT